jgi:hypothetical protein
MTQVLDTPETIAIFRLASVRGMVKLEGKGLKFRGGSVRVRMCKELGISTRTSADEVVELLTKRIAAAKAELQAEF